MKERGTWIVKDNRLSDKDKLLSKWSNLNGNSYTSDKSNTSNGIESQMTVDKMREGSNQQTTTGNHFLHDGENSKDQIKSRTLLKTSKRKLIILAYSIVGRILTNASNSVFNPIFPMEAKEKELDDIFVDFAYGIVYLITFIAAPIFGKYMSKIGAHFLIISSLYVSGCSNLFFACLHYSPGNASYLVLILLSRSMFAISRIGYFISTQAVVFYEFNDELMGVAQSLLQGGTIAGYFVGPAIAGFLFDIGGYSIPFFVIGGASIIHAIVSHISLPRVKEDETKSSKENGKLATTLMSSPIFVIPYFCAFIAATGLMNVDSTLTVILLPFGLSMSMIGLVFILMEIIDTFGTFFWGYVSDSLKKEGMAIIVGLFLNIIGYLMIGRDLIQSFLPYDVWTICVAVSFIGAGFGSVVIPVMRCFLTSAKELGFDEENLEVLAFISGMFNSAIVAGGFFGQFLLGIAGNELGNNAVYSIIALFNTLSFVMATVLFLYRRRSQSKVDGTRA